MGSSERITVEDGPQSGTADRRPAIDPAAPASAPTDAPRHLSDEVRHLTRAGEWWASLVGLLLGIAYLQILLTDLTPRQSAEKLAALVVSCALLAGYANVLNDLTDIEQDRASGRNTGVMRLGRPLSTVLVVVLALAGLAPWLVVPLSPAAWIALAGIVVLPLAYSLPGIRFKERGGLGVVTDALFEHVVPTAFIILLFRPDRTDGAITTALDVAVIVAAFATGLRGIVGHQLLDVETDRKVGVQSWVGKVGSERAMRAIRGWIFPVECAALVAIVGLTFFVEPLVAALAAVSALALGEARRVGAWTRSLSAAPSSDPEVRWVLFKYYRLWPAVFALVGLVVRDPWYLVLAALHLVLFRKAAIDELSSLWFYSGQLPSRWAERIRIRWHRGRMKKNDAMESVRYRRHNTGVAIGRGWNHTKGWWGRTKGHLVVARNHTKGWWLRMRGHIANAPKALMARIRRLWARVRHKLAKMVRTR
jgi:4-hydroxybenzoate polyprenyltransferase